MYLEYTTTVCNSQYTHRMQVWTCMDWQYVAPPLNLVRRHLHSPLFVAWPWTGLALLLILSLQSEKSMELEWKLGTWSVP